MTCLIYSLIFYGGTPNEYVSFVTGVFGLKCYIAQVDHTPSLPRIVGDANSKALPTFIPRFYYTYTTEGPVSVFRGTMFSPFVTQCRNDFDYYTWAEHLGTKKLVEPTDFQCVYVPASDTFVGSGRARIIDILSKLFPQAQVPASSLGKVTIQYIFAQSKRRDCLAAISKLIDCTITESNGKLILTPDVPRIRTKLSNTFLEYDENGSDFLSMMIRIDHRLLLSMDDRKLAQVVSGVEPVTFSTTDKSIVSSISAVMESYAKALPKSDVPKRFFNRDPSLPIEFTFRGFGKANHSFACVIDGKIGKQLF